MLLPALVVDAEPLLRGDCEQPVGRPALSATDSPRVLALVHPEAAAGRTERLPGVAAPGHQNAAVGRPARVGRPVGDDSFRLVPGAEDPERARRSVPVDGD